MNASRSLTEKIDVIIPVYRGLVETRACIESVLRSKQQTAYALIVINDCSPEPALTAYLQQAAAQGQFVLLENAENLGFVATVNRGMALHPERDILLLNSDTEVFNNWLDRIVEAAYSDANIATVTPMSNNATFCSYPLFGFGSELSSHVDPARIDIIFSQVHESAQVVDAVTAVGFCMFIKRACLNKIGLFDVEHFGKGYGEENDFSFRALKNGWRNVVCTNTYVYHKGGTSFAETRYELMQNARIVLEKLHPGYLQRCHAFDLSDPLKIFRHRVTLMRLLTSDLPLVLIISHARGGGTERHLLDLRDHLSTQVNFLRLQKYQYNCFLLSFFKQDEVFYLFFYLPEEYLLLRSVLQMLRVDRVHIHHLLDIPPVIFTLIQDLALPFDFTAHDFYTYCPQIHLHTAAEKYCGEPILADCEKCLAKRPVSGVQSIQAWRVQNTVWINKVERVFVPSVKAAEHIQKYFPQARIVYAQHTDAEVEDLSSPAQSVTLSQKESLRILLIGAISEIKGAKILAKVAKLVKQRELPLQLHILGYVSNDVTLPKSSFLILHGKYDEEDVAQKLNEIKPHLVWFPAQVPETYSYTLSIALKYQLPVVVTDLGALPERIAGRQWSWVKPWQTSPEAWADFFVTLRAQHFLTGHGPEPVPLLQPENKPQFRYLTDYAIPRQQRDTTLTLPANADELLHQCMGWQRTGRKYVWSMVKNVTLKSMRNTYHITFVRKVAHTVLPARLHKRLKDFFAKWL